MIPRLVLVLALLGCGDVVTAAGRVERTHPIDPNGAVRLDVRYGRIRVVGSDPGQVRVTGTFSEKLRGISVRDEAGAVEIRARFRWLDSLRAFTGGPSIYHVDLLVEVPRDTRLFVVSRDAEIDIEGITGPVGIGVVASSVEVRGAPAQLDFEAVSGSLEFEGRTPLLKADTLTGDLRVVGRAGDLKLDAATGSLEVLDAQLRNARLTTVSGDIAVRSAIDVGGALNVRSESGDVTLECRGPDGVELDLRTRDGEILNEVSDASPIREANGHRALKLTLEGGVGTGTARIRTRSGLIWVVPPTDPDPRPGGE